MQFTTLAETKFSPLKFEIAKMINSKNELIINETFDKLLKLFKKNIIDGVITIKQE